MRRHPRNGRFRIKGALNGRHVRAWRNNQALRATGLNLKDGKSLTGLVLREEGELIVLADNLGKEVRISKADVDERRTSLLSPMPANFNETIKEEDFHHLMAFLLQQRAKDK